MTTFNIYCHRFKEQRLEKSKEKQRKLGYKEGYDDMTSFSVLQTAWKTESAIHISNPQKWTSGFMDKRKTEQKTEFEIHISNPQRWTSEFQDKREENQY